MGQKVNPIGLRLGVNRTWDSRWFAGKGEYAKLLHEDMTIREAVSKTLKQAAVSKIIIERPHKKCRVTIHSARPGVVIGKRLFNATCPAACAGVETFHHHRFTNKSLRNDKIVDIETMIILGVSDCALQRLLHFMRNSLS